MHIATYNLKKQCKPFAQVLHFLTSYTAAFLYRISSAVADTWNYTNSAITNTMSHVQKEKDQKNSSKLLPLTQSFVLWGIPLWKGIPMVRISLMGVPHLSSTSLSTCHIISSRCEGFTCQTTKECLSSYCLYFHLLS